MPPPHNPPQKRISIVTGCFNEAQNIPILYERIKAVLLNFPAYDHEILIADNRSTDQTPDVLREIARRDPKFRVLLNANNFGPIRSGYNAFLKATGDAVVLMSSDLQDPPELIAELIGRWERGDQVVIAVKTQAAGSPIMFGVRRLYYWLLATVSEHDQIVSNFTGFGLYDRKVMDAFKLYRDPVPYFRGFVTTVGFRRSEIEFVQPPRRFGRSKHNFFTLYDVAMTGLVNHSRMPLRLAAFAGFALAPFSLLVAVVYLVYKLLWWDTFTLGLAPLVIGLFFFSSVQLIFIGIIGEYVGAILTHVKGHPLAIVDEYINFDEPPAGGA